MKSRVHYLLFGAAIAVTVLSTIGPTRAEKEPKVKAISAAHLNTIPVIGRLDQPLGTIVTIEGVVADESYTNRKLDLGHTLLRVQTVNGTKLAEERVFHFHAGAGIEKPKVNAKFKYVVYETGGFRGDPDKLRDYVEIRAATTGWGFSTDLCIVRDERAKK